MDKSYRHNRKKNYINGDKRERSGIPTGILASDGKELCTGDRIVYKGEQCVVLYNRCSGTFEAMISRSCWYEDREPENPASYGKSYPLPADNGAKMHIRRILENASEISQPLPKSKKEER